MDIFKRSYSAPEACKILKINGKQLAQWIERNQVVLANRAAGQGYKHKISFEEL